MQIPLIFSNRGKFSVQTRYVEPARLAHPANGDGLVGFVDHAKTYQDRRVALDGLMRRSRALTKKVKSFFRNRSLKQGGPLQ